MPVNTVAPQLADVIILAKGTVKIAPGSPHRKRFAPGQKVKKGFLFDGVHVHGQRPFVNVGKQLSLPVFACAADAVLPVTDFAAMGTGVAPHLFIRQRFPQNGFVKRKFHHPVLLLA